MNFLAIACIFIILGKEITIGNKVFDFFAVLWQYLDTRYQMKKVIFIKIKDEMGIASYFTCSPHYLSWENMEIKDYIHQISLVPISFQQVQFLVCSKSINYVHNTLIEGLS